LGGTIILIKDLYRIEKRKLPSRVPSMIRTWLRVTRFTLEDKKPINSLPSEHGDKIKSVPVEARKSN
tara:strand:+ start:57 stop:257 length:201 start_codon:yes stop_codon:yes gene_type:complete